MGAALPPGQEVRRAWGQDTPVEGGPQSPAGPGRPAGSPRPGRPREEGRDPEMPTDGARALPARTAHVPGPSTWPAGGRPHSPCRTRAPAAPAPAPASGGAAPRWPPSSSSHSQPGAARSPSEGCAWPPWPPAASPSWPRAGTPAPGARAPAQGRPHARPLRPRPSCAHRAQPGGSPCGRGRGLTRARCHLGAPGTLRSQKERRRPFSGSQPRPPTRS